MPNPPPRPPAGAVAVRFVAIVVALAISIGIGAQMMGPDAVNPWLVASIGVAALYGVVLAALGAFSDIGD